MGDLEQAGASAVPVHAGCGLARFVLAWPEPSDLGGGLGAGGAGTVGAARAGRSAGAAALARCAPNLHGAEGLAVSWLVVRL